MFAFCLGGCVLLPTTENIVRAPRTLAAFVIDGRLAVRQGDKNYHVNIAWQHEPTRDEMLFTNPLGQGIAQLYRDAVSARLEMKGRSEVVAFNWEALAADIFGMRLPLDQLPRWVLGQPADPALGWRVAVLDYASPAADALPTLIEFRRDDIEVRLKIDEWSDLK